MSHGLFFCVSMLPMWPFSHLKEGECINASMETMVKEAYRDTLSDLFRKLKG
jgi:hypothetical protein